MREPLAVAMGWADPSEMGHWHLRWHGAVCRHIRHDPTVVGGKNLSTVYCTLPHDSENWCNWWKR